MRLGIVAALAVAAAGGGLLAGNGEGSRAACSSARPPQPHRIGQVVPSTSATDRLYAVTDDGDVYVTESGSNWPRLPARLPGWAITPIGSTRDVLYSGFSPGLFRSRDGGRSWQSVSCGWIVTGIAGSRDAQTVYVATVPSEATGNGGGLGRTTDGGKTWTLITDIPRVDSHDLSVNVVAVQPREPRHVYIAMESGGIDGSVDGGEHFRLDGIDQKASDFDLPQVNSLAFGAGHEPTLWAGTRFQGVFRRDSATGRWTRRGLARSYVDAVVADRRRSGVVFAVVDQRRPLRWTVDGGLHWRVVSGLPASVDGIAVQPRDDSFVAWNATTAFRSRDHGKTWTALASLLR